MGKCNMTQKQALEVLNLEGGESPAELKTAYRKEAMVQHPDKGGTNDKFVIVKSAYDYLRRFGTAIKVESTERDFINVRRACAYRNPFEVDFSFERQQRAATATQQAYEARMQAQRFQVLRDMVMVGVVSIPTPGGFHNG